MPGAFSSMIKEFNFARFAADIRNARRARGFTVRGMGKVVKLSAVQYNRWENMKSIPHVSDFLFVCWFFDLDPQRYFEPSHTIPKTQLMSIAGEVREWNTEA